MRCYKDSMSVYKRNGKYYCRFQIDGERHHYLCNGANTKAEAEKIENGFEYKVQQRQNGVIAKEEKTHYTLKYIIENFLNYSKINRSVYKQDIGRTKVIEKFFDVSKRADKIIVKDVENFKLFLLNRKLSKKTINLYLAIMRGAYNLAVKNKWLTDNPFNSGVDFKLEPRAIKYLTDIEVDRLYKTVPKYFYPLVVVALNTGLRRTNLLELKWCNLDFNFKMIEITKNKGNKHIKLPMNDLVYETLIKMERKSEYIFLNPRTNGKWNTTAFTKEWEKIRQKAGLKEFKFHGLRHTVCTRLAKKGVAPVVIKMIAAHSDIRTTMQYIHIASQDLQDAVEKLSF